ncbi:substrate-binding periplasmic protein [Thiovibrio sp. JS02]
MNTTRIPASLFFLCSVFFLLGLAGCTAAVQPSPGMDPEFLRVGVTPDYPYLIYRDGQTGAISGLEAEFAKKLAARLGKKVRFVELTSEHQFSALAHHEVDIIMSAMVISEMRRLSVDFTEPYLITGQLALTSSARAEDFPTAQAILAANASIGVEKGTTGDIFVQRFCPGAEEFFFPSPEAAVNALKNQKIDLFVHDAPVIWFQASRNGAEGLMVLNYPLTREELAWAVGKNDLPLLQAANSALAAWRQDGSLQAMLREWFPFAGSTDFP